VVGRSISHATVTGTVPPGFRRAAAEDFRVASFIPAFRDGKPVECSVTLPVWAGSRPDDRIVYDGAPATRMRHYEANAAGLAVQYKVGRVIRILQWHNPELYEAAQSEKFALAAISWYIAASEYNRRLAEAGPTPAMNRALSDLKRGDEDFFGLNAYRAWGRYRLVWQRVSGL
jgi:hypothetical protein